MDSIDYFDLCHYSTSSDGSNTSSDGSNTSSDGSNTSSNGSNTSSDGSNTSSNTSNHQIVLFKNKDMALFQAPKINNKDLLIVSLLEYICTIHNSDERLFYLLCEYLVQNDIITDSSLITMENSDQRLLCQKMITSILNPPSDIKYKDNYPIQRIRSFTNDRYHSDFIELEKIGKGGFGTVFKAYNKLDSGIYAIKKINITKLSDQANNYYLDEVKYLSKLSHQNIVRYYGTWIDCRMVHSLVELVLYIQMEFCDSSLETYLIDRNYSGINPDYQRERDIFRQIVKGVKYIHKNNIIHGDLSTANIFLCNGIIKIGDFGLAKQSNTEQSNTEGNNTEQSNTQGNNIEQVITTRSYGNRLYIAPERCKDHICSKRSDIYSLGIVFLELFMAFKTIMEKMLIIEAVRNGRYDSVKLTSDQLILLKSMTEIDYQRRASIEDIKL